MRWDWNSNVSDSIYLFDQRCKQHYFCSHEAHVGEVRKKKKESTRYKLQAKMACWEDLVPRQYGREKDRGLLP